MMTYAECDHSYFQVGDIWCETGGVVFSFRYWEKELTKLVIFYFFIAALRPNCAHTYR